MSLLAEKPKTEVPQKPERRRMTVEYKQRILEESDRCTEHGELGALLRREGLCSSHITRWRRARDRGELAGLEPKKRGPKAKSVDARDRRIAELERQVAKLEARAEHAEAIIEVQKKVSALLGIKLPDPDPTGKR